MIGVHVLYLLLLATIQFVLSSFLTIYPKWFEKRNISRMFLWPTLIFLSYNLASILKVYGIVDVVDYSIVFLPFGVQLHFLQKIWRRTARRRLFLTVALILTTALTIFISVFFFRFTGYGPSTSVPIILLLLAVMGFIQMTLVNISNQEKINRVIVGMLAIGVGFCVLVGLFLTTNGKPEMFIIINSVYIIIFGQWFSTMYWQLRNHERGRDGQAHPAKTISEAISLDSFPLTKTERQVADGLLEGVTFQELSDQLGKSVPTLHKHASEVYRKTNTITQAKFIVTFLPERLSKGNSAD